MQNITALLLRYRECARVLWNNFLWSSEVGFDTVALFDHVRHLIFQEMVMTKLNREDSRTDRAEPLPFLQVVPTGVAAPILINRSSSDGNRYWDHPVDRVSGTDATLRFIDFFDWDVRGVRDLAYYLVRIEGFAAHPECNDRDALLEVHYAKVYLDNHDG